MPARSARPSRRYSLRSNSRPQNGSSEEKALILDSPLSRSPSPTCTELRQYEEDTGPGAYYTTSRPESTSGAYYSDTTSRPESTSGAYYSDTTSPESTSVATTSSEQTQHRSAKWTSPFRSMLKKSPGKSSPAAKHRPMLQQLNAGTTAPETEEQIDAFLADIWQSIAADNSQAAASMSPQYTKKVKEMKESFDRKISEITQREVTCVSELMYCDDTTPLIVASQLAIQDRVSLRKNIMESKIGYQFDELRFKLKQDVTKTILGLHSQQNARTATTNKTLKLKPKAAKFLNEWFECHLDNPFPSEAEKQLLASRSKLTVEQVSTWFQNKQSGSDKITSISDDEQTAITS